MSVNDKPARTDTTGPLSIECPVCGAPDGGRCFSRYQPQYPARTHLRRWSAAGLLAPSLDERIAVDTAASLAAQGQILAALEAIRHGR